MAGGRSDRRFQFTLAFVAAMAVVLGAVIGVGGSYLATRQQIASQADALERQADQSRDDYLRTQRRIAYAALIRQTKAFDKLQSRIDARLRASDLGDFPSPRVYDQQRDLRTYDSMLRDLEYAHTNVQIVGSTVVLEPASKITRVHQAIRREFGLLQPFGPRHFNHGTIIPILERMDSRDSDALQGFISAAREDLVGSESS